MQYTTSLAERHMQTTEGVCYIGVPADWVVRHLMEEEPG